VSPISVMRDVLEVAPDLVAAAGFGKGFDQ
jgi:hypothetical protein